MKESESKTRRTTIDGQDGRHSLESQIRQPGWLNPCHIVAEFQMNCHRQPRPGKDIISVFKKLGMAQKGRGILANFNRSAYIEAVFPAQFPSPKPQRGCQGRRTRRTDYQRDGPRTKVRVVGYFGG